MARKRSLIPCDDLDCREDLERLLMGHSPKLQAILQAARKRFRAGAGIPHEEFWKAIEAENAGEPKKRSGARKRGPMGG